MKIIAVLFQYTTQQADEKERKKYIEFRSACEFLENDTCRKYFAKVLIKTEIKQKLYESK